MRVEEHLDCSRNPLASFPLFPARFNVFRKVSTFPPALHPVPTQPQGCSALLGAEIIQKFQASAASTQCRDPLCHSTPLCPAPSLALGFPCSLSTRLSFLFVPVVNIRHPSRKDETAEYSPSVYRTVARRAKQLPVQVAQLGAVV